MKNTIKLTTLLLGFILVFGSSCKYPESGLSLRTKKARVVNVWKVEKFVDANGNETNPNSSDLSTYEFKKDGTYEYKSNSTLFPITFVGTWEFTDKKKKIKFTNTNGGTTTSTISEILKLKNKELWLKDTDGDQTHFVQK